jgi:hypothetical protein
VKSLGLLILSAFTATCAGPAPRNLNDLAIDDSVYVEPATRLPYSGPVFRAFEGDPKRVQIEGELLDGSWDGELAVYHPNGRIRYLGSFSGGERCGPWTENADSVAASNVYDELTKEIESMGLYPPCAVAR